jgi:hypothetical protein
MKSNGRIDAIHKENLIAYDFFKEDHNNNSNFQNDAVRHIHTSSAVGDLFFSEHNIEILQDGIRYSVYKQNNNVIGLQSTTELQIIMRSIYLQYSRNLPTDVVSQVKELNTMVLNYAVPRVLSEFHQYINYTKDITYLPIPLERSKNTSSKGTKVLHLNEM